MALKFYSLLLDVVFTRFRNLIIRIPFDKHLRSVGLLLAMFFVLYTISVLAVRALTIRTTKRLLAGMRTYVNPQIITFTTLSRTKRTMKISNIFMLRHMRAVIIPSLERFTTNLTRKRSQIIMHPLHMYIQLKLICEHLTTYLAAKPFLVLFLMRVQLRLRVAPKIAPLALQAFFRHVRHKMLTGVHLAAKFLVANRTLEFTARQPHDRIFSQRRFVHATYMHR